MLLKGLKVFELPAAKQASDLRGVHPFVFAKSQEDGVRRLDTGSDGLAGGEDET